MSAEREMTLDEVLSKLPSCHRANKELAKLKAAATTPQRQGDGFTAADVMDARAEERSRLSGSQVSGGGEVTVSAKEISILRTFFPDATTHELTDAVIAVKHEAALPTLNDGG